MFRRVKRCNPVLAQLSFRPFLRGNDQGLCAGLGFRNRVE
jgi:hypothetical protein